MILKFKNSLCLAPALYCAGAKQVNIFSKQ